MGGGSNLPPPLLDQSVLETGSVIRLEIIHQGRALWLETQPGAFLGKPVPLFRIVVGTIAFDSIRPCLDFFGRPRRAMAIEPGDDLLVGGTRSEQLLDFIGLDALELEEHLIKGAGVVIFANGALNIGTSLVDHAGHQRVAAETVAGAARWFFGQSFCSIHDSYASFRFWLCRARRCRFADDAHRIAGGRMTIPAGFRATL